MVGDARVKRTSMAVVLAVLVAAVSVVLPGGSAPVGADGNEAPASSAVFRALSAHSGHTCAILFHGSVKCWGVNDKGQLGLGDTANRGVVAGQMGDALPAVNLGTGRTASAISAGRFFTCAVLDNGSVKCWGQNLKGQLGLGDTATRGDGPGEMGDALPAVNLGTGRTAVAISAGTDMACAILDNGSLKCWGGGAQGRLGLGDTIDRGDGPGEMGDALPAVNLGTGRTAVAVGAGSAHTCAVLDNGSLKCWGNNASGQLGQGDLANRGDGPGEMGDALPPVNLGTGRTASAVTLGDEYTCALLDNGSVKCWGFDGNGALGLGTSSAGTTPSQLGDALPTVDLGTGRTAVSISGRINHACAVLDDGSVKCWGANFVGQLGLGDSDNRGDAPGEMGDVLPAVALGTGRTALAVTTGNAHTCAVLDDGSVKCWGLNNTGQLGLGDTVFRGDGPNEMGNDLPAVQVVTPAPAMTVVLSKDEATVVVGSPVHYHVLVTNTGNVGLTGFTVTSTSAPDCVEAVPTLLPGGSHTIDCTYAPTVDDVGLYSATVTVDSAQTSPVTSNTATVTVTIPAGQALVKGTVTAVIFGNPVSGALVAALDADGFSLVGMDLTAGDGTYAMLVPADSVFFYIADPANNHIAKFHQNSPTTLTDGATVTVNPQITRALGGIEGQITDAASGDGVATGVALSTNPVTGQMSIGAVTDGFGFYVIRDLRSVGYLVTLLDLAGAHAPRYYDGAATPATASVVNVVGGALQVIGTSTLPAQTPPGGTAHLNGVVTSSGGGAMADVAVVALNAGDYTFEAGDLTDSQGGYDIAVDPGSYIVGFADTTGSAGFEWNHDQPGSGLGSATPVTAAVGADGVVNASLASNRGAVGGTITEDGSGVPLADMWVFAIDSTGSVVGVAKTAADGTYTISDVPVGGVRVRVIDITGAHTPEYYDNHAGSGAGTDYPSASIVTIVGGATTTVDAALAGLPSVVGSN